MKPEDLKILIVTDVAADAAQIARLLEEQFQEIATSTVESRFVSDFEHVKPDVVVLAFTSLERAERYSLGLYRHSQIVHALPHRNIVLCDKDNVHRAFELCRKAYFDDYVMFWPMVFDTPRLAMSILIAGRSLQGERDAASTREVAAHARSVSRLDAVLAERVAVGQQHADALNEALKAVQAIDADRTLTHAPPPATLPVADANRVPIDNEGPGPAEAETFELDLDLDDLPSDLDHPLMTAPSSTGHATAGPLPTIPPAASPRGDVVREVRLRVDDARKRVVPLTEWIGGLKRDVAPQLEAARRLGELAGSTPHTILVVDDDPFQSKLLERLLGNTGYGTMVAQSGTEALALLGRRHPDLILMDVGLPDLNGIELTRRLKSTPALAAIPIVMITGHSERPVLEASVKAGAVDFLVKPFEREVLLHKITHHLVR